MNIINYCNKIIEYSFYALFFLVPLVLTNSNSELFELNKMWVTWGLTIIITGVWGAKMLLHKKFLFRRTPLDIPILLFLISQILATFFSIDTRTSIWGYYSRFNGGLLSLLSYTLLYYAFAANMLPGRKKSDESASEQNAIDFNKYTFLGGVAVFAIGLLLTFSTSFPAFLSAGVIASLILFVISFRAIPLYRTLFITLLSGVLVVLWGIPSHYGQDPTCLLFRQSFSVDCWTEAFRPTIRIFSTLGQPAWMAAYVSVLLPITLAFLINKTAIEKPAHPKNILVMAGVFSALVTILLYLNQWGFAFLVSAVPLIALLILRGTDGKKFISGTSVAVTYLSLFAIALYVSLIFANTRGGFFGFWAANTVFWTALVAMRLLPMRTLLQYAAVVNITFLLLNSLFGWPIEQLRRFEMQNIISSVHRPVYAQALPPSPTTAPAETAQPTGGVQTPEQPTETAPQSQPGTGGTGITDSGKIRLLVWEGAIKAWQANRLFGTGVETFAWAYYKHRPAEHNLTSEWDYLYNKAHNEYLNYLATTGALGFGTYILMSLWFFFVTGRKFLPYMFGKPEHALPKDHIMLIIALMAAYVSILVSNFFGFSVVIINLFLFLLPLFVFALGEMLPSHQEPETEPVTNPLQWAGIIVLAVIALYCNYLLFTFWRADKAYALGYNYDRVGGYQEAYPLLQQAVALRPAEPLFKDELAYNSIALAMALYSAEQNVTAGQLAEQAITLNNDIVNNHPNNLLFWKNRVRIFYSLSQIDQKYLPVAVQALEKSHELAPTDAKIAYNLGVLLGQSGRMTEAVAMLEKTIQLKPDYQDAYFALGVYYHDLATEGGPTVKNSEYRDKAVRTMRFVLDNLNPNNDAVKAELEKWGPAFQ